MKRRTVLAATAALATARLSRPAIAENTASRVLKYIPDSDLTIIDPLTTTAYITRNHGHMVWDTLYGVNQHMEASPQMAAGHVVENDGKRWVFTLRDGLIFHDGEKVRAQDAVASIKRWMQRDTLGQTLAQRLNTIRALDDQKFELVLNRPFGPMLDALAKPSAYPCFIMPERLASQPPERPITEAIGSGPYRFMASERVPGRLVVYQKFNGYVPRTETSSVTSGAKLAHFERMEWHSIFDPATATAALQTGEIDWWEQISSDLRPLLEQHRDIVVEQVDTAGMVALMRPNHLHPPFDNPEVRRALWPALNQADFMHALVGADQSMWKTGIGCFPADTPLASDAGLDVLTSPRDLEAAKAALRATGYRSTTKVTMLHATSTPSHAAVTPVAIDLLQKVGFNVEDVTMDFGSVVQRRTNRNPPARGGWNAIISLFGGMDLMTPGSNLLLRANGADAWFGWPTSERLEALRNDWLDAPDLNAQKAIARDIQIQFFQDVPYYPLGQYFTATAYRKDLTGVMRGMTLPLNVKRS